MTQPEVRFRVPLVLSTGIISAQVCGLGLVPGLALT